MINFKALDVVTLEGSENSEAFHTKQIMIYLWELFFRLCIIKRWGEGKLVYTTFGWSVQRLCYSWTCYGHVNRGTCMKKKV